VIDVAARLSEATSHDISPTFAALPRLTAQSLTVQSPTAPVLPVSPALAPVLPDGLRRGSTVAVSGSVSLLLAVLGAASAGGAWCAMVGMPAISAEAARDFGIELSRLPLVPCPGSSWVVVVGALLDAVDVVVARAPARLADGDIRRLAARARSRGAVFVPFLTSGAHWPHADVRLSAEGGSWSGIGLGYGRLRQRQVTVTAAGRGQAARRRTAVLWLPTATGGVEPISTQSLATVVSFEPARFESAQPLASAR
jgi:hypothetical protein